MTIETALYVRGVDSGGDVAPKVHVYVSDEVAAVLRARAHQRGVSVSKLLAEIVNRDVNQGWPAG